MKKLLILILCYLSAIGCKDSEKKENASEANLGEIIQVEDPLFTITDANKLLELPLKCVSTEYPNKLGQTLEGKADLKEPSQLHPIFYGCFDWHSAAHGVWSIVSLLKQFPEMDKAEAARQLLIDRITEKNVTIELAYFEKNVNKSFERTYGWAWLLKLAEELHTWDDPMARNLEENLKPLTNLIVDRYKEFLPKLVYPIRTGEHPNTAFGLTFAYDYALSLNNTELQQLIENRAKEFYLEDKNCPITWEPSGFDFLSPCLEEMDIMRRVLPAADFIKWMDEFLPQLAELNYNLEVGEVSDRTDGKLVHLDGLNFSRAWCFYGLANQFPKYAHLKNIANKHIAYSYPNLVADTYEGGHWLGSFAIYALNTLHKK